MSRRTRVTKRIPRNYYENSDSSEEERHLSLAVISYMQATLLDAQRRSRASRARRAIKKNTAKNTPKKNQTKTATKTNSQQNQPEKSAELVRVVSGSSNNENSVVSDTLKETYQKNVEKKVDNFLVNLLSDDEDEEVIPKKKQSEPVTVPKNFYALSDSDDDNLPSTSVVKNTTQVSSVVDDPMDNKDKELMEIVDNILDCEDTTEEVTPNTKYDNWNEFKNKTEEILGSVTALLDTLKSDSEKLSNKLSTQEKSPVKAKPTCPICLETLEGSIIPGATVCGHIFCMNCIKQVAKTSKSCPTCRKRITMKLIHPLYM